MKKILILTLILSTVFIGCGSKNETNSAKIEGVPEAFPAGNGRVAIVRNLPSDDHTKQFLDGARKEGEGLGLKVDTFIAENDDVKFQELVAQAIAKKYDGMIISHGKKDYSYDMLKPAIDNKIEVVTFDTVIEKNGETLTEVTKTFQDDYQLAKLSLDEIVKLSKNEKPVNVIKVWFGPGVPPLDRREEIYKTYEKEGKIKTLETIGPSNFQDIQGDIANKMSSVLAKYPAGTVDAIWGSWDEMAKGAYKAIKDEKREEIVLISIDVSNQDLNLMREKNSSWISTAAVDPGLIGIINMRLLAKKLAKEDIPEQYDLEARLIKVSDLKEDTNMFTLDEVIEGWGKSEDFKEKWMNVLNEKYKK